MGYQVKWVEDNLGVTRKALRNFEKLGLMPPNEGGGSRIVAMSFCEPRSCSP